jgi:hydroxyacylglutathione hydrolase
MYITEPVGIRGILFGSDAIPDCPTYLYLIKGKKNNYLVDTGFGSGSAEYVKEYVAAHCPGDIIVINTHYHWDHIWGNIGFEGSAIYAHPLTIKMIGERLDYMEGIGGKYKDGQTRNVLPNVTIADNFAFDEDGIEVFYTPGHTVDSISVYDRVDKVLQVGDNMETPFPIVQDTEEHLASSLKKYLAYDFMRCISGHNADVKREDILTVLKSLE